LEKDLNNFNHLNKNIVFSAYKAAEFGLPGVNLRQTCRSGRATTITRRQCQQIVSCHVKEVFL